MSLFAFVYCYTSDMTPLIDIPAINSFDDVLEELRLLEKKLGQNHLSHLATFNTAYHIITHAIKDAATDNYFKKPLFIEQFTVCFASYYFRAINDMVSGSPKLPAAWEKLRDITDTDAVPLSITLLMGANAHINHDLPVAMASFLTEDTDYSLRDARKVDKILMKSGRQIIPAFTESPKLLNTLKYRLQPIYYHPVMYSVLIWRIIAWRNYEAIKRDSHARDTHIPRSTKIAHRLLKLGKLIRLLVK